MDPTFETQVLVSLEEIKGDIKLVKQQGEDMRGRINAAETKIAQLQSWGYKAIGAMLIIASLPWAERLTGA